MHYLARAFQYFFYLIINISVRMKNQVNDEQFTNLEIEVAEKSSIF